MLERLDYAKNERTEAWESCLETTGLRTDPLTAVYGIYKDGQLMPPERGTARASSDRHQRLPGGTVFHELPSGMITEALDDGERLFLYTRLTLYSRLRISAFGHAQIDNGISYGERRADN